MGSWRCCNEERPREDKGMRPGEKAIEKGDKATAPWLVIMEGGIS